MSDGAPEPDPEGAPEPGPAPESDEARRALEALLMVTEEPATPQLLAQLLEVSPARVEELCATLAAEYEAERRGFQLVRVAGGYRFQSHPDQAAYVERFVLDGQSSRLSAAALETLAIVAYKQPISRAQVAAIRGVSVDGVMRTLQQRGYITEVARDPGPGQAVLFGTTRDFLERLGIDSLDDLPPLAEFVPGPDVVEALEHGLRIDTEGADDSTASTEAVDHDDTIGADLLADADLVAEDEPDDDAGPVDVADPEDDGGPDEAPTADEVGPGPAEQPGDPGGDAVPDPFEEG